MLLNLTVSDIPRFYFNRAARIWIPYYIGLSFIVIASLLKDPINIKWLEFIFYKFTFVYNIFGPPQLADYRNCMPLDGTGNHFWSVNAEEQFYLLAPLILVFLPILGRAIFTWVLLVGCAWYFNIYAPISLGVFAAVLVNKYGEFYLLSRVRLLLVFLIITAVTGFIFDDNYQLYAPIFSICVVMLCAVKGNRNKIGVFLGGMSYPLYLNHWIGVFFFNMVLDPFGLRDSEIRQFLACLMNYAIAGILYWYVDRIILLKRSQFFSKKRSILILYFAYGFVVIGVSVGMVLIYLH